MARQPDPQRARPGHEDHRQVHRQGLAVDADLHRAGRVDLESRRAPFGPPGEPADLARRLERRECPGLGRVGDQERHDPEHAIVQPRTGTPPGQVVELIWVVRHQDQLRRLVGLAVRPLVTQVELGRARAEQVRQHVRGRPQFRVPVLGRLDDLGVKPQRGVVHERPPVDGGQVDPALDPVRERVERAHHVVAI